MTLTLTVIVSPALTLYYLDAKVNATNNDGLTALMHAPQGGHIAAIEATLIRRNVILTLLIISVFSKC